MSAEQAYFASWAVRSGEETLGKQYLTLQTERHRTHIQAD